MVPYAFILSPPFPLIPSTIQHGEQQRRSSTSLKARQIPASSSRVLRPFPKVRFLRKMVRLHWKRQSSQRLEDALRCQHLPGTSARRCPAVLGAVTRLFAKNVDADAVF